MGWDLVDCDLSDCDFAEVDLREAAFAVRDLFEGIREDRDLLVGALLTADVLDTDFDLPADLDFSVALALADVFLGDAFADPLAAFRLNRRCTLLIS